MSKWAFNSINGFAPFADGVFSVRKGGRGDSCLQMRFAPDRPALDRLGQRRFRWLSLSKPANGDDIYGLDSRLAGLDALNALSVILGIIRLVGMGDCAFNSILLKKQWITMVVF